MTEEREWRSVNGWEDTARQYAVNADYWRERADAAERRIERALACHVKAEYSDGTFTGMCDCGFEWDTVADRCTSPTVTALTAETEGK